MTVLLYGLHLVGQTIVERWLKNVYFIYYFCYIVFLLEMTKVELMSFVTIYIKFVCKHVKIFFLTTLYNFSNEKREIWFLLFDFLFVLKGKQVHYGSCNSTRNYGEYRIVIYINFFNVFSRLNYIVSWGVLLEF